MSFDKIFDLTAEEVHFYFYNNKIIITINDYYCILQGCKQARLNNIILPII